MTSPLAPQIQPKQVDISDAAALPPSGLPKGDVADDRLKRIRKRMEEIQLALGAEEKRSVLVVLQGRDTSGKDGVIKGIFGDLNPMYCSVHSFKRPTPIELRHDFLWRVHQVVPPAGTIGVFNRSHYEDVLVVRVHEMVPEPVWRRRFGHIRDFERMLTDAGALILKFMLHISREEQRERLESRLADPSKNWKFEEGDLKERALWERYTDAYREMICETGTEWAPWYVVPADKKTARDILIGETVLAAMEKLNPAYPPADPAVLQYRGKIA